MIRVLFINHSTILGGAETNLLNILGHAEEGGFQPVGVLLPDDGPLGQEVKRLRLPVGIIDYHAWRWRNPLRYGKTIAQLVGWVRATRADLIHLNHQWLVNHITAAGRLTRTPVICHTRNYLEEDFVVKNQRWFDLTSAILVVSKAAEQRALELGLSSSQVRLIYDSVDADRFMTPKPCGSLRAHLGVPAAEPIVGFSGRIVPEKGPEDLINAAHLVLRAFPRVHFVFAGIDQDNGAYTEHLRMRANVLGIGEWVHFIGFRNDVETVLAGFDVLVLPSRRAMREGLPLTALEGLAVGCVIVATPNSGLPEVVRDGETGLLVEPEQPSLLASALLRALSLPEYERQSLRQAGQALVRDHFRIETQIAELGHLYRELLP